MKNYSFQTVIFQVTLRILYRTVLCMLRHIIIEQHMRFSLLFFFTWACVIKGVRPCALATSVTSEGFCSCYSIMQQGTIPDLFLSLRGSTFYAVRW